MNKSNSKKPASEKLVNISIPAMLPAKEPEKRRPRVGDLAFSGVCDQSGIIVGESCGHYVIAYCDEDGDINLCSGGGHQHVAYGPPPIESRNTPTNISDHARMLLRAARFLHELIERFDDVSDAVGRSMDAPLKDTYKTASELVNNLAGLVEEVDAIPTRQLDAKYRAALKEQFGATGLAGLTAFVDAWMESEDRIESPE